MRPGITSWGQVKYGYAENVDQMIDRMKYDLLYLKNRSLSLDFKIMFLMHRDVNNQKLFIFISDFPKLSVLIGLLMLNEIICLKEIYFLFLNCLLEICEYTE